METFFPVGSTIADSAGFLDILCQAVEDRGKTRFDGSSALDPSINSGNSNSSRILGCFTR